MIELLNWRGKLFWIALCGISLWTLIIMESIKIGHETRYLDGTYFWFLLIINLLAHFLLWMSGTPFMYPEAEVKGAQEVRIERRWYHVLEVHPAVHYATGGFGKFFFLLVMLDIYYYGCIMRDEWYEVIRVLVMHATLVVGIFILNSHNRVTTSKSVINLLGMTLFVYNIVMIVKTFFLLTHSVDHHHDIKAMIPIESPIDLRASHHGSDHTPVNVFNHYLYRGYVHTRIYDMVLYTCLLLFFSLLLKIREKLLYNNHDVLGWNIKIEMRDTVPNEKTRLLARETVVVDTNPLEA